MSDQRSLIFVYNAPDGIGAALLDAVHKAVSPDTYACSLCFVTYGAVSMKREWREWLKALPMKTRFLHRDGFRRAYPRLAMPLPAVLIADGAELPTVVLDAAALAGLTTVDALIAALEAELGLEPVRTAG